MGAGLLASSGRSSCLSDLEPPRDLTQGPLLCVRASFSQDGFYHQGVWEVDKNYRDLVPLPTLTPRGAFLYMCRSGGSLTSSIRNMWSLYLLSEQDPAPPCSFHNHLAVICAQGTGDSCWAWDPSTSCFGFVPCPCGAASHPV